MSRKRSQRGRAVTLEALEPRTFLSASLYISEFMAKNSTGLKDQDGAYSDWIEIYNGGAAAVDLNGYSLTDSPDNLTQWKFPSTNLAPGGYQVVFASGKDRHVSGQELHTNFSLSASGEYLALVEPDGTTIDSQYSPTFPPQYENISYGLANLQGASVTLAQGADAAKWTVPTSAADDATWMTSGFNDGAWSIGTASVGFDTDQIPSTTTQTLLDYGAPAYALIPTSDIGTTWHNPSFTPTGWLSGTTGVGYERSTGYEGVIGLNVGAMYNTMQSCYIRVDFNCPDPSTVTHLTLSLRVDDAAVVWLNGSALPIATSGSGWTNYPNAPTWNSGTTVGPSDPSGYTDYDITAYIGQLVAGRNVLAIQGMNNGTTSSDFLVIPKVTATVTNYTTDFAGLFQTNVQSAMKDVNSTLYTRIPFNVTDPAFLRSLALNMKYDDGFIAYINGTKIVSRNAPISAAYNSTAMAEHLDDDAVDDESIDLSSYLSLLHAGTNVLAIQALNLTASDSDFLMAPTLVAVGPAADGIEERYFQVPSPGAANTTGVNELGPIVTHVTHSPTIPADADPLTVTAEVSKTASAVTSVVLHYRVNWNTEATLPMYDDGAHGDGAAADGVYGAIIPASASTANQMVRYYVTAADSAAHTSRMPLYLVQTGARQSSQYYGTVVSDPNIHTNIPLFQYFIQTPTAADSSSGARGDVFYLGELYDNVFFRKRGSTINGTQTVNVSRKVEFNSDHNFLYTAGKGRVSEINMNLPGPQDSSYLRQTLSYWMYDQVDVAGPASFLMHCQQNGSFMGVRVFWQHNDADELEQEGLDPNGGLYRAGGSNLSGTGGFTYKTANATQARLQTLVDGVKTTNANRHNYVMDNLDLAALVNYLAVDVILEDTDSSQTNYYVYQDVNGDGEWRIMPYDRDLTWGCFVAWGTSYVYDDNGDGLNTVPWGAMTGETTGDYMVSPMFLDYNYYILSRGWNRLADAVKRDPVASQMFFRRVRTLMDEWLKPTGTPAAQLAIENRIDALVASLSYEAANNQLPPQESGYGVFADGVADLKNYLALRRSFLYATGTMGFTLVSAQPAAVAGQITIGTVEFDPTSGNQDQEYIQFNNPNSYAVDVSGWHVTGGVDYTFPQGTVIVANSSMYVAKDAKAFRARTVSPRGGQGLFVQGGYNGNLSNQGETIRLVTDQNVLIDTKTFGGDAPAINEIMTNNGTGNDWIELFNPTAGTFDLSDWHLSDSTTNATKYTIPAGTTVASGAYIVFTEAQFGSAFGMSKNGESVVLSNAAGTIIDSHDFNGSDVGVTFGRYTTREGLTSFTALTSPTPGSANSAALVGPVVINEIMYNSTVGNDEFIELKNITASPVKLYDTAAPAHTWTLSGGVDYTFPTGVEIPANALLILTEADVSTQPLKDAFRAKYAIPSDAQIFGPWQGSLNNGGEDININKVGRVDPGDGSYPVIRVDRVEYSPTYPWPSAADGTGKSLERISAASFGNDPFNWQSFRNGNPGYQALLQGDANRDGKVSFADYLVLESSFGKTGQTWTQADFNNDGKVNFADYLLLEANFGKSVTLPGPGGAPPIAAPLSVATTTSLAASAPVDLVAQASTATLPADKTQVVRGRKLNSSASVLFKLLKKTNLLG